jgi:hypothetical protein
MKTRWLITLMCQMLEVSASGYFGSEASGRRPERPGVRRHSSEGCSRTSVPSTSICAASMAGSHCSRKFQDTLASWVMPGAMSRQGNRWP